MYQNRSAMASLTRALLLLTCLLGREKLVSSLTLMDAVVDFSLGAVAGGVGAFVAYPVDYVKCQMMTESGKEKYKNGMDCFVKTVTQEGPLQLFRGVQVQVAGIAPEKAIKLGVNDMVKGMFVTHLGVLPLWGELVAGSIAGVCQVVATSPLEVIKVGLQTSDKSIPELMDEIGGVKGLFRGAEACILRDVIFSATLFPIYLHAQEVFPALIAGSIAGVAAGFVGTPPDFIKTRILTGYNEKPITPQTPALRQPFLVEYRNDGGNAFGSNFAYGSGTATSSNPFLVARDIAKREGWQVMFTGVVERCIGSIPRFGVTLSMYDYLKVFATSHGWLQS